MLILWVLLRFVAPEHVQPFYPPGSQPNFGHLKAYVVEWALNALVWSLIAISHRKLERLLDISDSAPSTSRRVGLVFVGYVGVLFFFGGLYESIYRDNPESFLFASEIAAKETDQFVAKARSTLTSLQDESRSTNVLVNYLDADPPMRTTKCPRPFPCAEFQIDYSTFLFYADGPPDGESGPDLWRLYSLGRNGTTWDLALRGYQSGDDVVTAKKARAMAEDLDRRLSQGVSVFSKYVNKDPSVKAQLWSFWDFLYFSGITLTTVGYGDILPNSTPVRMVVLSEVLMGLFLLGYMINVISIRSGQR